MSEQKLTSVSDPIQTQPAQPQQPQNEPTQTPISTNAEPTSSSLDQMNQPGKPVKVTLLPKGWQLVPKSAVEHLLPEQNQSQAHQGLSRLEAEAVTRAENARAVTPELTTPQIEDWSTVPLQREDGTYDYRKIATLPNNDSEVLPPALADAIKEAAGVMLQELRERHPEKMPVARRDDRRAGQVQQRRSSHAQPAQPNQEVDR